MSRKADADFATLALDGSAVHAAWAQLYTRCGSIVRRAVDEKRVGRGCFARPEADVALLHALATMDAIDPDAGWLEAGMLAYLYSMDDALRRADEVWWGHDWLEPIDGRRYSPFEEFNVGALLRKPHGVDAGTTQIVRLLIGTPALELPEKLDRHAVERRRKLYDALQLRAQVARGFLQRPDQSYPKIKPVALPPIAPELGEPLWRNGDLPLLPGKGIAGFRRFGHVLARGLAMAMREAGLARAKSPCLLGLQHLSGGYEKYSPPRLKYWLDSKPFSDGGLLEAAILDRLTGAPPGELLQACLGTSRYLARETKWSLPHAPKWLRVEQWDAALISAAVNDADSLATSRQHAPTTAERYPPGTRVCGRVLAEWTSTGRMPVDLAFPKSLDKLERGFVRAMAGLSARDSGECAAGVREMLAAHSRIDYRFVRGQWFSQISLQAIAVQRMARRAGLVLDVPPDGPNDAAVVEAPDPSVAALPWVPVPGIDLVANDNAALAWPSLYVNQPVREVLDPPIQ